MEKTLFAGEHTKKAADCGDVPIVRLSPYRTFREIEQPRSEFLLRVRSGSSEGVVNAALFEADGGAWRHTAMTSIAEYIKKELPEIKVIA
jgi:hypothetical protein